MFVQIHTLRDYSTALPNRGQDGLKRTIYGGIGRQRISSQCFKSALRDTATLVRTGGGTEVVDTLAGLAGRLGLDMSVRSALIGERKVIPALISRGMSDEDSKAWSDATMALWRAKDAKPAEADTPLVVGEKEISALADVCVALANGEQTPKSLREFIDNGLTKLGRYRCKQKWRSKPCGLFAAMLALMGHCSAGLRQALRSTMWTPRYTLLIW
jgi:CT1975-like protein